MRAEKIIKQQARQTLADNNWGKALAACIFLICGVLLAEVVQSLSVLVRGANVEAIAKAPFDNPAALVFFLLVQLLCVVVLFAVYSPMLTGYIAFNAQLAQGRAGDFSVLFAWFSDIHRYFKSVLFCLLLAVRYIIWAVVCFVPCIGIVVWMRIFSIDTSYYMQDERFVCRVFLAVFIVIGLILWVLITSRYFLAPYLFAGNESYSAKQCIVQSVVYMKQNRGKYIRLLLAFFPWLLSCFLVIPLLYVMPYFQASCALSARWMLEAAGEEAS